MTKMNANDSDFLPQFLNRKIQRIILRALVH